MSLEQRHLHLRGALGLPRTEMWDGREHLVIPCVALQEGVVHAVNSRTPEFVGATALTNSVSKWAGHPIVVGHPVRDGKQVSAHDPAIMEKHACGFIRQAHMNGPRLGMEAMIDPARLEKLEQRQLLADLRAGKNVEISVGAFVTTGSNKGTHGGRAYDGEWTEIHPDHTAFLPGGRGACSVANGCGANRFAMRVCGDAMELEPMTLKDRILSFFRALKADTGEAEAEHLAWSLAFGDEQDIRTAVGARHSSGDVTRIQEVHDAAVSLGAKCGSAEKTIDQLMAEGTLLAMAAVPGESKKTDCPACNGSGNADGNPCEACDGSGELKVAEHSCSCEGDEMDKKDRIKALMEHAHNPLKSLKALEACSDDELKALEDGCTASAKQAADLKTATTEAARLKTLAECKTCKGEGKAFGKECPDCGGTGELKAAELVTSLKAAQAAQIPAEELTELRALAAERKAQDAAEHAGLVVKLKTATVGIFTEDELKTKSLSDLRALARVAKIDEPRVDRSPLMPQPRHAQSVDQFAPPNPYPALVKQA